MTIPLARLASASLATPASGAITLAVARHESHIWESSETSVLARARAALIHGFVKDHGIDVKSWGNTDSNHPHEIVELVIGISAAVIPSVAAVLAAWIARPSRAQAIQAEEKAIVGATGTLLPGIKIKRHNGDEMQITYRDKLTKAEIQELLSKFLSDVDQ